MSDVFEGAVLYTPTADEVEKLKFTINFIDANPINIEESFKKHTTPHWWSDKIDWPSLTAELDSFIGWRWVSFGSSGEYRYAEKRRWAKCISDVLDMLSMNSQCWVSPKQVRAIQLAKTAYENIKNIG